MAAEAAGLARKRNKILSYSVSLKGLYHSVPVSKFSDDINHE